MSQMNPKEVFQNLHESSLLMTVINEDFARIRRNSDKEKFLAEAGRVGRVIKHIYFDYAEYTSAHGFRQYYLLVNMKFVL